MAASSSVTINGSVVPVVFKGEGHTKEEIDFILAAPKVKEYFETINPDDMTVQRVEIFHGYKFGRNLGFAYMEVLSTHTKTGKNLPGVVFLRGDSVACLIVIEEEETGKLFFVLVEQVRVPSGRKKTEGSAGMADEEVTELSGPMIKEIEQETGIKVKNTGTKNADPKKQFNYLEKLGVMEPSPGGTRERIHLYWYQVKMSSAKIAELHNKNIINEEADKAEILKVFVKPFNFNEVDDTDDCKMICAMTKLMRKHPGFVPME